MIGEDFIEDFPSPHDMLCSDLDIDRLSFDPTERLMDQDFRVFQCVAFSFCPTGEDDRSHRCRESDTDRDNIRLDILHRIVDRESSSDMSTRRVHIECDRRLRVFFLEEEKLSDDRIRDGSVDRISEEDDTILEESGVDIIRALLSADFIDDGRDEEV